MSHKDFTGYDLHVGRSNTGTGSPNGVRTPSVTGELYTDLSTGTIYTATGTSNTSWVATPAGSGGGTVSGVANNIKNYGTVGSGQDATTALQNCLNANGSAYIPAGTYVFSNTINVPSGSNIRGDGYHTEIKVSDTFPAGNILFAYTGSYNTTEDLLISGNSKDFVAFGDQDPARTSWSERWRFANIVNFNQGNDTFRFTGRGLDYIWENIWIDKCHGYGMYLRNISDSNMTNCSFAEGWKSHVDMAGGNLRCVQCKFMMQGNWTVDDPYPAVKFYNSLGLVITGCEFQQNQWDALVLDTMDGAIITACNFDSNNQKGLTGNYASIKLINSHFVRADILLMDGRDFGASPPYNSQGLNGIVVDDKSCWNNFTVTYHPYQFPQNGKYKHCTPFVVPVNDISSMYILNNRDYFKFGASDIVVGSGGNAVLSAVSQSANFTITAATADGGNRITATQGTTKTMGTTGEFFTITIPLTMAQFTGANLPTNKTMVYVTYECKIYDPAGTSGLQINGSISESSTVTGHTTATSSGLVRVGATQNKNTEWMPMAMYKTLSYSADAGFQVNILLSGSSNATTVLNAGDILAQYRNIRVSFF